MFRFNFFLLVIVISFSCSKTKPNPVLIKGNVFGTSFNIVYEELDESDYSREIDSIFHLMNTSLSTYQFSSDISRINHGDSSVVVDEFFKEVFEKSSKIYKETNGVFDPTIGVLVNAWGFGPNKSVELLNSTRVSKLLEFVGFHKVQMKENKIYKDNPNIYIDFNAIAKGYGVDVVSRFLEVKGVQNYMVEIGGEVRVRGVNSIGNLWRIGIEKPNEDGSRSLQQVVELENESIATSGNYRKFKIDSITGEKYVHTIDTKTGYTAKRDLLSASVIAPIDCADVDGYATSFMAMGLSNTIAFLEGHQELKVFLIYLDDRGKVKSYSNFDLIE